MNRHPQHAVFASRFREWARDDWDGFQYSAKQVREVTAMPGWTALVSELERRESDLLGSLTVTPSGLPVIPSYEQYAAVTGEIRGIQRVLGLAQTMLVVADEEEKELAKLAGTIEEG